MELVEAKLDAAEAEGVVLLSGPVSITELVLFARPELDVCETDVIFFGFPLLPPFEHAVIIRHNDITSILKKRVFMGNSPLTYVVNIIHGVRYKVNLILKCRLHEIKKCSECAFNPHQEHFNYALRFILSQ